MSSAKPLDILLIRPKSTHSDVVAGIPIGIAGLASLAESRGHRVRILDIGLEPDLSPLGRILRGSRFDIAGLSCMSAEFLGGLQAASVIRETSPGTHVIFGGQHPSIMPEQCMKAGCIDSLCIGEGEHVWSEFLDRMAAGTGLEGVRGLWFRRGSEVFCNPPRAEFADVDALPMPAYHLLDMERYFAIDFVRFPTSSRRALQIFTSRGCPYRCIYCHDLFGKRFRGRRPELVWEEIRQLHDTYGIREFMVEDDVFNMDMERAKRICDLVIASGLRLGFQFGNGLRLDRFDEELMQKLALAGTHHIAIAVESASPRIQKVIRKNLKLDRLDEVLGWARKHGIGTMGFFMLGFPGESVAEIRQTIRFARDSRFDEALFSIATPYAGTEMSRMVQSSASPPDSGAESGWEGILRVPSDEWSHDRLLALQRKAYFVFFLRRWRFLKILMKMTTPRMFRRYWSALARNFLPFLAPGKSRIN